MQNNQPLGSLRFMNGKAVYDQAFTTPKLVKIWSKTNNNPYNIIS